MNFMMLPLCTSVTDARSLSIAYWIALRTSRSVPSRDTGLMPMPDVSGKRIFLHAHLVLQERRSPCARSSVSASHSMPA